jgi:hypothetical protein
LNPEVATIDRRDTAYCREKKRLQRRWTRMLTMECLVVAPSDSHQMRYLQTEACPMMAHESQPNPFPDMRLPKRTIKIANLPGKITSDMITTKGNVNKSYINSGYLAMKPTFEASMDN